MHTPSVFESSLVIVPMLSTTGWLCRRCASETRSCLWCAVTGIVVSGAPPPPNGMAGAARWDVISHGPTSLTILASRPQRTTAAHAVECAQHGGDIGRGLWSGTSRGAEINSLSRQHAHGRSEEWCG